MDELPKHSIDELGDLLDLLAEVTVNRAIGDQLSIIDTDGERPSDRPGTSPDPARMSDCRGVAGPVATAAAGGSGRR